MAIYSNCRDTDELRLKIEPHPPQFLVKGQVFEITVYLVDGLDELKVGLQVPLQLDLMLGDTRCLPRTMTIDPKTPLMISGSGMCTVKLAVNETSMANRHQMYHLRFTSLNSKMTIASISSTPITVVRYRLAIQNKLPEIWYKDEGSRDKCLEFDVQLSDGNDFPVAFKSIPLRITLIYENGHHVFKQDILKASTESNDATDEHGKASVKVRIEDVSRNHQSQPFQIKVEPALPMHQDIAFATTSSVIVRSKRNKLGKRSAPEPFTADIVSVDTEESTESSPKRQCLDTPLDKNMENVLNWTRSVLQVLESLEWQQVGYEAQPDGSLDYSRPLYRCPSCWRYKDVRTYGSQQHASNCSLATLLLVYATETIYDYESLVKLVETTRSCSLGSIFKHSPSMPVAQHQPIPEPQHLVTSYGAESSSFDPLEYDLNYITSDFTPPQVLDNSIYYVLAQIVTLDSGVCAGFPAYDVGFNLIGFYQALTTPTTQIVFCRLGNCQETTLIDIKRIEMLAHRAHNTKNPALFNRSRFVGDLDKLKENVLFFFWEANKSML